MGVWLGWLFVWLCCLGGGFVCLVVLWCYGYLYGLGLVWFSVVVYRFACAVGVVCLGFGWVCGWLCGFGWFYCGLGLKLVFLFVRGYC